MVRRRRIINDYNAEGSFRRDHDEVYVPRFPSGEPVNYAFSHGRRETGPDRDRGYAIEEGSHHIPNYGYGHRRDGGGRDYDEGYVPRHPAEMGGDFGQGQLRRDPAPRHERLAGYQGDDWIFSSSERGYQPPRERGPYKESEPTGKVIMPGHVVRRDGMDKMVRGRGGYGNERSEKREREDGRRPGPYAGYGRFDIQDTGGAPIASFGRQYLPWGGGGAETNRIIMGLVRLFREFLD